MPRQHIAHVLFPIPVEKAFDYEIPEKLEGVIVPGVRVTAPFGKGEKVGYVASVGAADPAVKGLRPVSAVLDETPLLSSGMFRLAGWMADRYACSQGEALAAMLPSALKKKRSVPKDAIRETNDTESAGVAAGTDGSLPSDITAAIGRAGSKRQPLLVLSSDGSFRARAYLSIIEQCLRRHASAIVLAPAVESAVALAVSCQACFPGKIVLLHSRLGPRVQLQNWTRIFLSDAPVVVIGTRSAVFAPVEKLGALIIDEEEDSSYKQEDTPRYHAREVAETRTALSGGHLILGSACPSVETFYAAEKGAVATVDIDDLSPGRFSGRIEAVDARLALGRKETKVFSKRLEHALQDAVQKGKKAILFISRRGFSTYLSCPACQFTLQCDRCSTSATYHYQYGYLMCHRCNKKFDLPELCPRCKNAYVKFAGVGTEKIESECARLFPQARIQRMDTDVVKSGVDTKSIVRDFLDNKIDILVGTQLLAREPGLGGADLIGVISTDLILTLPHFRASEETFQLLFKLSGKLAASKGARLILQTYAPDNFVIQAVVNHDYRRFFKKEIELRELLKYPPFGHAIKLCLKGKNEKLMKRNAYHLANSIRKHVKGAAVIGPFQDTPYRLRGVYRWSVLVKVEKTESLVRTLKERGKLRRSPQGTGVTIDVDPY
ncbi:MAG: primosomal protein N' [Candidatus Omnitrophica bacterium]|nr:primosomal protein N' [Candidatus Omnitrophota bacterium]